LFCASRRLRGPKIDPSSSGLATAPPRWRYNDHVLRSHADELFWVGGLFIAVVVTAALVNRFRPIERPRLRRLVTMFVLFAVATTTGIAFDAANLPSWSAGFGVAAQVLQAFTLINLTATVIFAVALPRIGLEMPLIASDVVVGIGYVVITLVILAKHGLNPTSALVSTAVISAVLVISLQSTLGNIVGGVALQLDGSIREGDWIQLENGKQGRVCSVRWRHTVLETRDWSTIIVPNAQLLSNQIIILGKRDGRAVAQRMAVTFSMDLRIAPSRIVRVVTEALQRSAIPNVAADPRPVVMCIEYPNTRDQLAIYAVRYWVEDVSLDEHTSSRVRARVYTALQRAQIPFAPVPVGSPMPTDDRGLLKRPDLDERLVAIRTVSLFRTLTEDELRTLAGGLNHVPYSDGELITRQGAPGQWLYILTAGTVEIRARVDRQSKHVSGGSDGQGGGDGSVPLPVFGPVAPKVRIAQLTAPDFFGEMSLMTGEPRTADVIAVGDVECFRLGQDTFKTVLLARPEIATELSATLATRRVELSAARGEIETTSVGEREASERDRILRGIKAFFALGPR
jgi:CRP-like cAMP-binding protein/small-conductance mechanosensitive channel